MLSRFVLASCASWDRPRMRLTDALWPESEQYLALAHNEQPSGAMIAPMGAFGGGHNAASKMGTVWVVIEGYLGACPCPVPIQRGTGARGHEAFLGHAWARLGH